MTLAFEDNILKHPQAASFKEKYASRSKENAEKLEKMSRTLAVWRFAALTTLDHLMNEYGLGQDLMKSEKFLGEERANFMIGVHKGIYRKELYSYGAYFSGQKDKAINAKEAYQYVMCLLFERFLYFFLDFISFMIICEALSSITTIIKICR